MVEMFVGLMMLALVTGMMFARFSRPRARFFVQEASAQLRMLRDTVTAEGLRMRRITDLALVRASQPAFFIGWTIMHVIDESSPRPMRPRGIC